MAGKGWKPTGGGEWHDAAMSGRPVLAFGTPRYGFDAPRHALVFFETGEGWREANTFHKFTVTHWQPLDEAPRARSKSTPDILRSEK